MYRESIIADAEKNYIDFKGNIYFEVTWDKNYVCRYTVVVVPVKCINQKL